MDAMNEENSMEGSRPLTRDSKLMLLFDFTDHAPGIGLISHITRPILPIHEEDAVSMLKVYIETKRQLGARWSSDLTNTSAWHLKSYTTTDSYKDTIMRGGKAVLLSDDKDELSNRRQEIIKELTTRKDKRVCRSLFPRQGCSHQDGEDEGDSSIGGIEELQQSTSQQKRSYQDLQEEIMESEAKILKPEYENKQLTKVIEDLRKQLLETQKVSLQLLIKSVREQTTSVQRLIEESAANSENAHQSNGETLQQTPSSIRSSHISSPTIRAQETPVKFHGSTNINPSILRSAIIKGRTKTKNAGRRLNATVATLLSAWWTDEELSKISLAGKACPSIPGSKAKAKFNEEILDAITQFLIPKWEKWHGVLLTPDSIKASISDRLLACHTKERKKKLASSAANDLDEEPIDVAEEP